MFVLAGWAAYPAGTRFLFSKRNRGKKRRRGELLVPLSTPLQRTAISGAALIAGVQRFPDRRKAWNWPRRTLEILPQKNESRGAFWGSPEGGIPPLGFLSHRFLCKESGAPAEQAARPARTNPPGSRNRKRAVAEQEALQRLIMILEFTSSRSDRGPARSRYRWHNPGWSGRRRRCRSGPR